MDDAGSGGAGGGGGSDGDGGDGGAGGVVEPLRIMPLGDSITWGRGSYRGFLHTSLTDAGYVVDFVGSSAGVAPHGGVDPDHEGHRAATIGPGATLFDDEPGSGWASPNNLYDHLPDILAQEPEIVLLLIGINDYTNYVDPDYDANAESPAKLSALLEAMFQAKPGLSVLVSSLLPVSEALSPDRPIQPFNDALPGIVTELEARGLDVHFVDLHGEAGLDADDPAEFPDGLHPVDPAGIKMAEVWFDRLIESGVLERAR